MIRIHLLRSLFKNELSLGNSKTCTSDEMLLLKLKLAEFSSQQQSFRHSNEIHTSWRGNAENIHEHENAIPLQQQQHEALIVQKKSYDGEFSLDFLSTFLLVKLFLNLNVKKLINNANGISRWKERRSEKCNEFVSCSSDTNDGVRWNQICWNSSLENLSIVVSRFSSPWKWYTFSTKLLPTTSRAHTSCNSIVTFGINFSLCFVLKRGLIRSVLEVLWKMFRTFAGPSSPLVMFFYKFECEVERIGRKNLHEKFIKCVSHIPA